MMKKKKKRLIPYFTSQAPFSSLPLCSVEYLLFFTESSRKKNLLNLRRELRFYYWHLQSMKAILPNFHSQLKGIMMHDITIKNTCLSVASHEILPQIIMGIKYYVRLFSWKYIHSKCLARGTHINNF